MDLINDEIWISKSLTSCCGSPNLA